jgi:hypothetical protein
MAPCTAAEGDVCREANNLRDYFLNSRTFSKEQLTNTGGQNLPSCRHWQGPSNLFSFCRLLLSKQAEADITLTDLIKGLWIIEKMGSPLFSSAVLIRKKNGDLQFFLE